MMTLTERIMASLGFVALIFLAVGTALERSPVSPSLSRLVGVMFAFVAGIMLPVTLEAVQPAARLVRRWFALARRQK